jgi:lysozyme
MKVSEQAIAAIKRLESYSGLAYRDCAGRWTIGYGQTSIERDGIPRLVREGDTTTHEEADAWLRHRLAEIAAWLSDNVDVPLTQGMTDALGSFAFNCGLGALRGSSLWSFLQSGQFEKAANEFPKWCHAGGKEVPGLAKRRALERSWFEEPETPQAA